jgi:hypothetical protein
MCIYEEHPMAVQTNSNQFLSVQFRAVLQSWDAQTATEGLVFSSSMNQTFKHYLQGPSWEQQGHGSDVHHLHLGVETVYRVFYEA